MSAVKGISPRYAPPEVFSRMRLRSASHTLDDDKASDVYSMGVLLWETVARLVRVRTHTHTHTHEIHLSVCRRCVYVSVCLSVDVNAVYVHPRLSVCHSPCAYVPVGGGADMGWRARVRRSRGTVKATLRLSKTIASACVCPSWYAQRTPPAPACAPSGAAVTHSEPCPSCWVTGCPLSLSLCACASLSLSVYVNACAWSETGGTGG
jgi:hypothetical protein